MVQCGECLRLTLETIGPFSIGDKLRGENLKGHPAIEFCLAREVNLPDSPLAEQRFNLIRTNLMAHQRCLIINTRILRQHLGGNSHCRTLHESGGLGLSLHEAQHFLAQLIVAVARFRHKLLSLLGG